MQIREIDVADDADMSALYAVSAASGRFGREGQPYWSEAEMISVHRAPNSSEEMHLFLAEADDVVVGATAIWLPLHDNVEKAYLDLDVHPEHRRRGHGTALLEYVTQVAREKGRTRLLGGSKVPPEAGPADTAHPYRAFATARGARQANVEIVRHLALPVSETDLDGWVAQAAARHGDHDEIRTYVNEFPDELAESLCTLIGQLVVDAPTGEVDFEEETMTPQRLAESYAVTDAMGRDRFETVAVHDGVVAAQSTLAVPRDGDDVYQWGTFVHREHRGRSLGLAVKAANLRAAQAAYPGAKRVTTQNAETNQWMIAVNVLLGFEAVEASVDWYLDL